MNEFPKVIGVVPARSSTKGLPGKNTMNFAGRPLYLHAVEQALRVTGACVITTDIEEIFAVSMPDACLRLRRDPALAKDDTPMEPVIDDVICRLSLSDQVLVLLQATTPLRLDSDLEAALKLHSTGDYDMVMTVTPANSGILKYGTMSDSKFIPVSEPGYCFANRQQLPNIFRPNGAAYVFSAEKFRQGGGRFPGQRIGAITMPAERSCDIDTYPDFEEAAAHFAQRTSSPD